MSRMFWFGEIECPINRFNKFAGVLGSRSPLFRAVQCGDEPEHQQFKPFMSASTTIVKAPPVLEKHIEKAITALLEIDGWRAIKMEQNFSERKRKTVGEPGMADHLYIRYADYADRSPVWASQAQVLFIEFKKLRGGNGKRGIFTKAEKASIKQRAWIARERSRGALVLLVGEDCPATIEGVRAWYRNSGLARRVA